MKDKPPKVPKSPEQIAEESRLKRENELEKKKKAVEEASEALRLAEESNELDEELTSLQMRELKEREEFVRRVLSDDDEYNRAIKDNFAQRDKKAQEFSKKLLSATRFNPDYKDGLSFRQVAERKEEGLVNITNERNSKSYKAIFLGNIFTFFNVMCFVVAAALIYVESYGNLFFLVIMAINTGIGIFQEISAKRTVEKLSLISAPVAIVVREGEKATIPSSDVVLDEMIYLETGKQICSDSVVVRGEIEVNESMLTGESVPVLKKVGDTLYGGSFVVSGNCYARVDKIGNSNYIASLTAFAKRFKKSKSEILSSLQKIITVISILIIPIAALLFYFEFHTSKSMESSVVKTAGAVIGMIPAGMFLLTSIALFTSVKILGKKRILVQDMYCIENLARVNVLCLDKTGTITDGTMRVHDVLELKNETGHSLIEIIGSMLASTEDNNQTAMALARHFGQKMVLDANIIMPFSSQRKVSAVTFTDGNTYILGAPEYVMREMGLKMERIINEKAKQGLRVLMVAVAPGEIKGDKLPPIRKPLAIIAVEDHIREDAADTLQWFKDNDVAVKVISGDNPITVSEVARRVGIVNAELYVSLEGKTDPEVVELANEYTVFGRVTPEQKRILVRAIKAKGNTVAMTGDGVNDILALKEADCSVAIASGSEAARDVAHMVLMDSNFAHMPAVVFEGRRVVNNIQKSSSLYLMKTLFSIVIAAVMLFLRAGYPIEPKQMMLLEALVIGAPSVFLALQANSRRIEGSFLVNIIKKAFPAGLTLIFCFLALYIFKDKGWLIPQAEAGLEGDALRAANLLVSQQFQTMTVLILTFAGFMMLIRLCKPADLFRTAVCVVSGVMCLICTLVIPDMFLMDLSILSLTQIFFVAVIILSSYFVSAMLSAAFAAIKIN